jgi:dihydroxyacetone kinase
MLRVAAQLDCRTLSEFLHFGLGSLQQKTKAEVGDKTMMDALVPALRAFDQAGTDALSQALDAAAAAAQKGAEATVAILAKFGRAKTLGEKAVGTQDPRATSMALLFRGMAEAAAKLSDDSPSGNA